MNAERKEIRTRAAARHEHRIAAGAAISPMAGAVRAGAKLYDRMRDLPALVRVEPAASADHSVETAALIVARLERALRAERNRARSGHWTYHLNRHIALRQAFRAETERFAALRACPANSGLAEPA